jgi:hypothetical protein
MASLAGDFDSFSPPSCRRSSRCAAGDTSVSFCGLRELNQDMFLSRLVTGDYANEDWRSGVG